MLHAHDESVRAHLLEGGFGLEKESLRIDGGGFLAHTPADFADDVHIVRDFSENQVEVNTPVCATPAEAINRWSTTTASCSGPSRICPSASFCGPSRTRPIS